MNTATQLWELGKYGAEGLTLYETFIDWKQARERKKHFRRETALLAQNGEDVRDSYAWKQAGTWTRAEYARWTKAVLAFLAAEKTPCLALDNAAALAEIRKELNPRKIRQPPGRRKAT